MIAVDLGIVPYDEGLRRQHDAHAGNTEGGLDDVIFLLENDPVITMGKSGSGSDLLVMEEALAAQGIALRRVNRGGKITCHYHGQLVVYPVVDLIRLGCDVHEFVNGLEEIVMRTLADFGIRGRRIRRYRGVFVDDDKIASVGIEVRNHVTLHGFSLNVREDRSLYPLFVSCGIADKGITFLDSFLPPDAAADMGTVKVGILRHFEEVFSASILEMDREAFGKAMGKRP